MSGKAASAVLPALVVLVLVAVVAVASTGSTSGGSGATRSPSETLYDVLFTLGLVAVALGALVFAYGLMQRKAIQREVASGRYRRTTLLGWVTFVLLFTGVFYVGLVNLPKRIPEVAPEDGRGLPSDSPLPTLPEGAETSYTPTVSWIPVLVVVGLLLSGIAAYVLSERRARRGRSAEHPLMEQLALVLDETLDDIRAETDPRRAIIAAYARCERVLTTNGVARRPAETSDEYLDRILRELELAPLAIRRLTNLFQQAKFSHHEMDETMKSDAIDALEDVRAQLRRAPEPARGHVPVGAAT